MKIIKAGSFSEYLADKIGLPGTEGSRFEQKLCSALRKLGVVKRMEVLLSYEEWHSYEQRSEEMYNKTLRSNRGKMYLWEPTDWRN